MIADFDPRQPLSPAKRSPLLIRQQALLSVLAGILLCWISGCGGNRDAGPERFDVSGTVTFAGEPVPVGAIQFVPDSSQGNTGPAGYAAIKDGKYNTARDGKGTVGGSHNVVIIGFDGEGDPRSDVAQGRQLFPEFRASVDLPSSTAVQNFEVPTVTKKPK